MSSELNIEIMFYLAVLFAPDNSLEVHIEYNNIHETFIKQADNIWSPSSNLSEKWVRGEYAISKVSNKNAETIDLKNKLEYIGKHSFKRPRDVPPDLIYAELGESAVIIEHKSGLLVVEVNSNQEAKIFKIKW